MHEPSELCSQEKTLLNRYQYLLGYTTAPRIRHTYLTKTLSTHFFYLYVPVGDARGPLQVQVCYTTIKCHSPDSL